MAETIASHVTKCLGLFRPLVDSGSLANTGVNPIDPKLLSRLQDELSRFKVWSGNMGAHKTGTSSLDYRLRDATHIRDQVLNLLRDLNNLLKDATDIASGEITPWDELEEDPLNDQEESDAESPETELEQIAIDVADVVNCLLRLNADIRNPAPHQRFVEAANTDTPFFVRFDTQHVHAKFADIQPWLAGRLGEAISRRRQYFRYRQSHHAKLAAGLDEINPAPLPDSETVASSIPLAMKDQPGASAPRAILQDNQSDAGVSQTSYATSAPDSGNLKIPPLPKEAYKGPFECPFCFMIIVATDRASWKKHIYSDLKPYTCLAEDCVAPEREFGRRHEWMEHTKQNHWHTYKCLHGCEAELDSPAKCRNHLKTVHNMTSSQSAELDAFVKLSEQPLDVAKGIPCPLCQDILYSIKKYQQHVGRHQEQLSLFALPSVEGEGSEDEADEEIDSNEAASVNSAPAEQSTQEMVASQFVASEDLQANLMPAIGEDAFALPPAFGSRRLSGEGESARDHYLYNNVYPHADGLFHCPWEGQPSCNHKAEKLKCNYYKFVDSHLKPYRCKVEGCQNARFSSTASLLRHEREAHAMHGHGENPYLCTYKGCERSVSGHGFPRQWNLRDHMRRVHNGNDAEEKQSSEASDKANNSPAYHPPMSVTSHGSFELGSQNEMDLEQPEGIPLRKETTSPEKQAYESSDDESADIAYRRYTRDESPDSSTSIANQEHTANVVADGSQSVSIETEKPTKVAAWAEAARAEATKNDAQDTIKKREQPVIKPQPDYSDRDVGSVGARREKGKQKEEDKPPDGDGDLDYHSAEETALLGQEATASRAAEQVAKVKELQEETMAALEKAIKEQEEKLAKALEKRKKIQKERQAGEEAKAAAEKRAAEEGDVDKGISDRLAREMAEAVTRWNAKEAERDARERAEKEAADKEFRRRLFEEFRHSGLSETEIEAIMKKEVAKWRAEEQKLTEQIPESNRPTFTRMSLRHLEIETLNFYKVDWEWDAEPGYILIRRWVPEWEQNMLWEHTRKLRVVENRTESETSIPTFDKTNDHLQVEDDYGVVRRRRRRSKSPSLLMYLAGGRPA